MANEIFCNNCQFRGRTCFTCQYNTIKQNISIKDIENKNKSQETLIKQSENENRVCRFYMFGICWFGKK